MNDLRSHLGITRIVCISLAAIREPSIDGGVNEDDIAYLKSNRRMHNRTHELREKAKLLTCHTVVQESALYSKVGTAAERLCMLKLRGPTIDRKGAIANL